MLCLRGRGGGYGFELLFGDVGRAVGLSGLDALLEMRGGQEVGAQDFAAFAEEGDLSA